MSDSLEPVKSIYRAEQEAFQGLLKRLRLEAELTQIEMANRLDRPQSFVSKIESGERMLDVIELLEVCEALGVKPADFVRQLQSAINASRSTIYKSK